MTGKQRHHIIVLGIATAVLAAAQVVGVSEHALSVGDIQLPTLCAASRWFSMACPTCGLTRAFVAAAQGQWGMSWTLHMGGLGVFLLVVAQVPLRLLWIVREREFTS